MLQLLKHLDAAYNLARWLTQNEHDAEDIVKDSYLRAIRHLGGFHGGDGRAWLITIVRNRCYDSADTKALANGLCGPGPEGSSDGLARKRLHGAL